MATLQFSDAVNNSQLDAIETQIGTSAILEIRTGSLPANCAASRTGTVLATLSLPSDWMSNAATHAKAKTGTWQDTSADATGTAGYFTVYASDGTTVGMQGDVTATAGGGAMTIASTSITATQPIVVTGFTLTAGNT